MSDVYDDEALPLEDDLDLAPAGADDDQLPPDEGDGEGDALPQPGDQQPARQPSRRDRRIASLIAERDEARRRADLLETAARLAPSPEPRPDPAAAAAARAARIEQMSDREYAEFLAGEKDQQFTQALAAIEQRNADRADRAEFAAYCQTEPRAARLRDEVERMYQDENARRPGAYGRMGIFRLILADRILKAAPRARQRQQQAGAARVAAATTRPGSARSDAAPARPGQKSEREQRRERLAAMGTFPRGVNANSQG